MIVLALQTMLKIEWYGECRHRRTCVLGRTTVTLDEPVPVSDFFTSMVPGLVVSTDSGLKLSERPSDAAEWAESTTYT